VLLGPVPLLQNNFPNQPVMSPVSCTNIGGGGCGTIANTIGVLGTPVMNIDGTGTSGTLYVVAEMQSGDPQHGFTYYHFLHALEITTLAEGIGNEKFNAPIQVCAGGCGKYTSASSFSHDHIQRPGLLYATKSQTGLANDTVYVAFSMMDASTFPYPNGAIFGYNASNLSSGTPYPFYFQSSNGNGHSLSYGGGIWQGAAAPAFGVDSSGAGFMYFKTGDGTFGFSDSIQNWETVS